MYAISKAIVAVTGDLRSGITQMSSIADMTVVSHAYLHCEEGKDDEHRVRLAVVVGFKTVYELSEVVECSFEAYQSAMSLFYDIGSGSDTATCQLAEQAQPKDIAFRWIP